MNNLNPYAISFGKLPKKYINRNYIKDTIIDSLESEYENEQAFKITGIRGTGKTVMLTAIEREMRNRENWIVIGLSSNSDLSKDLLSNLYSMVPFVAEFIDANLNLSVFGIGVNISKKSPVSSIDYALKIILKEIKKRGKKVLITIDEVRKTPDIVDFIQEFQLLIREDLPIYVIVAGLYEDIESIENADGLTFFLRANKQEMIPLNLNNIRNDYMETIGVTKEVATEMATITKGYAFAYQALGKYMWESGSKTLNDDVLFAFDDALSEKVYKKIWQELNKKDRWFLQFIAQKDRISATELLEITKKSHSQWSVPRARLKEKGIINVEQRGYISMCLPRFKEFIDNQMMLGNI